MIELSLMKFNNFRGDIASIRVNKLYNLSKSYKFFKTFINASP